jgi:hypothetical protein
MPTAPTAPPAPPTGLAALAERPEGRTGGASEQQPGPGGASEALAALPEIAGASELLPGLARALALAERGRGFWLLVATELIIYGATEPDARVTVAGEPVALREDGTFTMRFALPDGRIELPVRAESGDGRQSRTTTPVVEKQTV